MNPDTKYPNIYALKKGDKVILKHREDTLNCDPEQESQDPLERWAVGECNPYHHNSYYKSVYGIIQSDDDIIEQNLHQGLREAQIEVYWYHADGARLGQNTYHITDLQPYKKPKPAKQLTDTRAIVDLLFPEPKKTTRKAK